MTNDELIAELSTHNGDLEVVFHDTEGVCAHSASIAADRTCNPGESVLRITLEEA